MFICNHDYTLLALLLRYPRIERPLQDFKFEIIENSLAASLL